MTTTTTISPMLALLDAVRGDVVTDDSPEYDEARSVHNAMFDRRPAAVVRAVDVADVRTTISVARAAGLDLAVRAGGHSVPGFGTVDDGLVLDLAGMRGIHVDPDGRTARVQGGCTWADLDSATHEVGLATTGGIISSTGVAGLTLGGGIGYLARAHGLSCDNLRAAEVVLADGSVVTASAAEHADLYWALRGGGGNFGVVTSMTFDLHPVDMIYGGPMFFELDDAEALLRTFRQWLPDAPRTQGGFPAFHLAPPLPFVPEGRHGRPHFALITCFNGPEEEGAKLLEAFRDVATPVAEHVGTMPYPALNSAFDALCPNGQQNYWKASFLLELTDGAIAAHVEHGARVPSGSSAMHLYPIDGAVRDVAPDATAFAYRDTNFATNVAGVWPDPADSPANTRWVREYHAALEPYSTVGGYVNFMAGDDQNRVRANYSGNYDRLVAVKRTYDPENLFHLNQNIDPTS